MTTRTLPTFSELSRDDAIALLARGRFGRLAFTFHDRVDIEPISYVYANGSVYARTSPGTKVNTVQHHPWVAFEVDEVTGPFAWRSVVVHGTIYFLYPDGGERHAYDAALEILRRADMDALTDADPAPQRRALFRIYADEITGRQATSPSR